MASGRKYHTTSIILIMYDNRLYILTTVLTITRYGLSASVPLAACYWSQVVTIPLPFGLFHQIPRGHPLLT